MAVSNKKRIVLLGKTGVGKSSLANTIFGEELFQVDHSFNSGKSECRAETRFINERSITLIDTPGFFDTGRSEKEMKSEIVRCIVESAPGPHALVIVLKVEKFTKQEQAVIDKICQHFSENALKYATVVFTHGDQLPEGMKIEEYVNDSEGLSGLMKKCGGRCHVVDNKYWKKNPQDEYRGNQVQVAELLKTIDKIVEENNREYFINETLQNMERAIQEEEERIKNSSGNKSLEEIRKQAKSNVFKKQVDKGLPKWIRGLVGFAVTGLIAALLAVFINSKSAKVLRY